MEFDEFAYQGVADAFARLPTAKSTKSSPACPRVSTMTLTSRLRDVTCPDTLMSRLARLTDEDVCRVGVVDDQFSWCLSRFCPKAIELTPFPSAFPGIRVRLFCTTGSLLISGCTHIDQACAALHDVGLVLGVPCEFPVLQLVNVTCAADRIVSLALVQEKLRAVPGVRVSRPERQARLLIKRQAGQVTVMLYQTGKFTVHGKSVDAIIDAIQWMYTFL